MLGMLQVITYLLCTYLIFKGEGIKGPVVFEKLHLTTGLRKGRKTNITVLFVNLSTLAVLFRKPTTLADIHE